MYLENLDEEKLKSIRKLERELPGSLLALACRKYDPARASKRHLKPACLTKEQLNKLSALENELGFCLFAVEENESLYVLEAKLAPNVWKKVTEVYPAIKDLEAFYLEREAAHDAKSRLKRILGNKAKYNVQKKPLRNRKIK